MALVRASVSTLVMPWPVSWKKPTSVAAARSASCSLVRSSALPSASERSITGRPVVEGERYCCVMGDIRWVSVPRPVRRVAGGFAAAACGWAGCCGAGVGVCPEGGRVR